MVPTSFRIKGTGTRGREGADPESPPATAVDVTVAPEDERTPAKGFAVTRSPELLREAFEATLGPAETGIEEEAFGATLAREPAGSESSGASGSGSAPAQSARRAVDALLDAVTLTPETEGRYQFPEGRQRAELGSGGIGRVLVALDRHLGREIAVKELLAPEAAGALRRGLGAEGGDRRGKAEGPQGAMGEADSGREGDPGGVGSAGRSSASLAARFVREARVTGQLEHPNIVPVYELGERKDGTLYYCMKLVRGRTFRRALRQCEGLADRLLLLSHYLDLCQAIAYAHSRGVIHRDIKTENVMLGEFGETVVLDWGLAKVRGHQDLGQRELSREIRLETLEEAAAGRTVDGAAMGTPAYMSPEQAEGRLADIDEQSDVWSLGAVLYEILTGHPPHSGRTVAEVLIRVVEEPVRPPRDLEPGVPPELAAIAERALERDRSKRYVSARELAREVEAFQSGARVGAYAYSSFELLRRFVARNRVLTGAFAMLVVVLLVAVGFVTSAWQSAEEARRGQSLARARAEAVGARERQSRLQAQQATRDAQRNMAVAYQEKADRLLAARDHAGARIFAAAALWHHPGNPRGPHHSKAERLRDEGRDREAISAAHSTLYQSRMHASLFGGAWLTGHTDEVWSTVWFPDGRRLATVSKDRTLRIWDASSGKCVATFVALAPLLHVAVSPDGTQVAAGGGNGQVFFWNVSTGAPLRTLAAHKGPVLGLSFSPRGDMLATSGMDGNAKLWEVATGMEVAVFPHEGFALYAVAFSPKGETLAVAGFGAMGSRITLWDLRRRQWVADLTGHRGPVWSLSFSPDGALLASSGLDQSVRLWSVKDRRQEERLTHHEGDVAKVVFSPDGQVLASVGVDHMVSLYHLRSQTVVGRHQAHRGPVWSVAWCPKGQRLVTASWDGTVRLWRVSAMGSLPCVVAPDPFHRYLWHSPDGRHVYALSGSRARTFDTVEIKETEPFLGHRGEIRDLAMSLDGKKIATASADGTVRIWDAATRKELAVARGHMGAIRSVSFSPDGETLCTGGEDGAVFLHGVRDGAPVRVIRSGQGRVAAVAFSPDGKWVAISTADKMVTLAKVADGAVMRTLTGHQGVAARLVVGAGGRLLAAVGETTQVTVWNTETGRIHRRLRGHDSEVIVMGISSDGLRIITGGRDKRVVLWDLEGGRAQLTLKLDMMPMGVSIHPSGKSFAVSLGRPIYIYSMDLDPGQQDPKEFLDGAQEESGLRLRRFRLVVKNP